MKIKKKDLLNQINRHEAVLNEMREELDYILKANVIYANEINDLKRQINILREKGYISHLDIKE